jgi:hypothetical protein
MPQPTIPPTNTWNDPDAASEPTIAGNRPEQPVEPPPPTRGPLLRDDGSWATPGEAMAAAQQQQDDLAQLGYPLWQQTKAQKHS